MSRIVAAITLVLAVSVSGCSRHFVVEPEQVDSLKSTEWTIKSEPVFDQPSESSDFDIQAPIPIDSTQIPPSD